MHAVQVVVSVHSQLQAAETQHSYSTSVPGWHTMLAAVAKAAGCANGVQQEVGKAAAHQPPAAANTGSVTSQPQHEWPQQIENAITNVLLWAQTLKTECDAAQQQQQQQNQEVLGTGWSYTHLQVQAYV